MAISKEDAALKTDLSAEEVVRRLETVIDVLLEGIQPHETRSVVFQNLNYIKIPDNIHEKVILTLLSKYKKWNPLYTKSVPIRDIDESITFYA